ncbi:hypothetical protein B0H14DRAFT_3771381 [Mycena olivaceomarginata]|nr:hypothetical protein B0H14DRAFT_3771381 [Mycena olivaceomarginata]
MSVRLNRPLRPRWEGYGAVGRTVVFPHAPSPLSDDMQGKGRLIDHNEGPTPQGREAEPAAPAPAPAPAPTPPGPDRVATTATLDCGFVGCCLGRPAPRKMEQVGGGNREGRRGRTETEREKERKKQLERRKTVPVPDQTKGAQVSISCLRWWSPRRMSRMRERRGIPKWRYTESKCLVSILRCASGMKCRAEGSGMHVMKHTMLALVPWRQHFFTPLQPPITSAILRMVAQPYMYLLHTLYRARAATRETATGLLPIWEIHVARATPMARAPELDKANSSWTIGKDVDEAKTSWKKINEVHATPITIGNNKGWCANAYFYRSQVDSNNTSWHIGSRTAPTPVCARSVSQLVDSDNTSLKIGCSVPTPVACAVSTDLIGGSVPTPVAARAVSPDLVDGDNTSWKILCNPVVQARAENVDSDNKSWEIHDTREEVDAANTSSLDHWQQRGLCHADFRSS